MQCRNFELKKQYNKPVLVMEVSSESPRVPPRDRVGDLPLFCARGVGHFPFIFARG